MFKSRFRQDDHHQSFSEDSGSDAFRNVMKNMTAFFVWKIQGLQAISVPRNKVGYFLSDSAYIIYAVSSKESELPYPGIPLKEINKTNVIRTIHFWIGNKCDSSISGAAALRTAELDAQINATLLFRESEGRESSRFLGYFRHGLTIEYGHFDNSTVKLHRVSGLSIPIINQLESITWSSFSSTDVIIIDTQSLGVLFIWVGSASTALHRRHAIDIIESRKNNNNNNKNKIIIVDDGYEQTLPDDDRRLFNSILDLKIRSVIPYHQDKHYYISAPVKLYKCSQQSGKYKVVELKSGPIFRNDLTSTAVFIIDQGEAGVWAWIGNDVDDREKLEAIRNVRGFVKKKGYSCCVPVARALENYQPKEIKKIFRPWEIIQIRPLILQTSFDQDYMNERPKLSAECQLVDDGTGKKIIWRVSKNEMVKIYENSKSWGFFYAGACYVMRYIYGNGRKEKSIIYCWEGAHSLSDDRDAALDFACKLAEETSGQLIKASQGREPPHLLQIYGGKLCILAGNHQETTPKKYLLRVFGSTSYTSKAIERPLRASSLDSTGVFILFSGSPIVWCGGKSTGDLREASRRLAPVSTPLISEGKENDEFWIQLGGKGNYGTEMSQVPEQTDKYMYHCNVINKKFVGKEIIGFSQSTLIPEAIWLLDTGTMIWVWVGNLCEKKNFKKYLQDAAIFLYTHPASRDRNTPISIIRQGQEPPTFTGLFDNWNHNYLRDYRSFDEYRLSLQNLQGLQKIQNNYHNSYSINHYSDNNNYDDNDNNNNPASNFDAYIKYPLKILKSEPDNLPNGIDFFKKEMHLTYDDFVSIFKMNPVEFNKLPAWRQQRLKQAAGLF
ncbi:villin-1 isoform X2 [Microplitis mediator]|uniref:villin-1 isoform X2 n=1 Tax=Microplitis mediator TaxID=375433 RepID=UPI00255446B2|nr:villin-1 isoform X2 [Microplitis mediator]